MKIELITIGDEILLGQTLDSNAHWIALRLADNGLRLRWHSTIGDDKSDIRHVLRHAWNRADVVLVTGGLGPTHDDITCEMVAKFFDDDLVERLDVKQLVIDRFTARNVSPPPGFDKMALFPSRAEPMINKHGSAPGIHYDSRGKHLFAMPGVPIEMKGLFDDYVMPILIDHRSGSFQSIILKTTGIGESNLSHLIGNADALNPVSLAYLPSINQGVTLRLSCGGNDEDAVQRHLSNAQTFVSERINPYIYAVGNDSLEKVILETMRKRGLTLAVAESCTGGMVCDRLVSVPGSSDVFNRGFITYSNEAKIEQLGVDEQLLIDHGAVSEQVARAMAIGAQAKADADIAVSVTGIAGPAGGSDDKPVGLVYIGIADENGSDVKKHIFSGNRDTNRRRSAGAVLNMLWKRLKKKR